jgi:uncharacterized repeat protein (TIGR03803 family)
VSTKTIPARPIRTLIFIAFVVMLAVSSAAAKERVLHSFGIGDYGVNPTSALIADAAGNLYGTTSGGGAHGFGTVFELTPDKTNGWKEIVLYSFKGGKDGLYPSGGLVWDAGGNLYGTTLEGGRMNESCHDTNGCGGVFELSPQAGGKWTELVLYRFTGCQKDGCTPNGGVVFDDAGNLYGTTVNGGGMGCVPIGCGTVFQLTPTSGGWQETIIHRFAGGTGDGANPSGGLIVDSAGDLFGTLFNFGEHLRGAVFQLTPTSSGWQATLIYNFLGGNDGAGPLANLALDSTINVLYGTTAFGGPRNRGTVFRLAPGDAGWTESVLHIFRGDTDGSQPYGDVILAPSGDLYGTTTMGGGTCNCGTVFRLTPASQGKWTEDVLHDFLSGTDGATPEAGLLLDAAGDLYGTTYAGGDHNSGGTVFEISPP